MVFRHGIDAALRRAFDRSVHAAARLAYGLVPEADPRRYEVSLTRDIPYRDTGRRAHLLDVYRPRASEPRPALLYVHGGAFSMLSKDTHRLMALAFASRGYAVFNANYRLAPGHAYPAPLEDACAALLWVMDHAAEHGADPRRIVLAGESAGANLVTALTYVATHRREEPFARAVFDRAPQLRAVLSVYGILDLVDMERFWRDPHKARKLARWIRWELAWASRAYAGEAPDAAPLASPLRRMLEPPTDGARPLPPFFLTAGTADPLLDDSRRLRAALEGRGVDCELHVYPGEIHGFNAMMWRPAARAKWRAAFEFLQRHVPLDGGADAPDDREDAHA